MNKSLNEKLINFINEIAENVFFIQFVISIIGFVLNIPHLLILIHNSMRTSSTNSIMIGIAICDLIVLSEYVYENVQKYWFLGSPNLCINQYSYWNLYSVLIGDFLQAVFEKSSFWLGVFLALTRLVIMKAAGTTLKISKPIFGYLLILIPVALSSVHSGYYFSGYSIIQRGIWEPEDTCTGYPANYSEPKFQRYFVDYKNLLQIVNRYQMGKEVSGVLIRVSYPILTVLLIFEIRKSAKIASKSLSKRSSEERNRTCRMILVMTILYVITSAPAGILGHLQLFVDIKPYSILETLVSYGSIFVSVLFCLNASSHGIINFTMSSKYRKTVKTCLGCKKQQ
ncbi:hypothetical protein B9Z55_017323 [Caenorhabditis nigoni]|uniref:G-protein coupled receptors family 1 profile domain-containing protein n=1 Tax=Caenorhabditis nigoni TaxID=1611254 RepID=A0A2G5T8N3_9PELO|nr:hypothetical protein B9Z55_017323 [Caenorhabditis nigoni]